MDELHKVSLHWLFNRFDANGDGTVTLGEGRKVEPSFGEKAFAEGDPNEATRSHLEKVER